MKENRCESCMFFIQHYGKRKTGFVTIHCGHCIHCRVKNRKPDTKACIHYQVANEVPETAE